MTNMDMRFNIAGKIDKKQEINIQQTLEGLEGVNHVKVDGMARAITVDYTPGLINVQNIKEEIESQGVDVADRGDD